MARPPIFPLRLEPDRRIRWDAAARHAAQNLTQFIIASVEARIASGRSGVEASSGGGATPATPSGRGASTPEPPLPPPDYEGTPGNPAALAAAVAHPAAALASCARRRFHRSGVFCKFCGATPP